MASLSYTDILIPNQDILYQKISVSPEEYSNYFSFIYIILKALIRAKSIPKVFNKLYSDIQSLINLTLSSPLSQESTSAVNFFKSLTETMKNVTNVSQGLGYLEHYLANVNYFVYAGFEIIKVFVSQNNENPENLGVLPITKILEYMVEKFPLQINLFWCTSNFTYSNQSDNPLIKFYLYYEKSNTGGEIISILIPSIEKSQNLQSEDHPSYNSTFFHNFPEPTSSNPNPKLKNFASDRPNILNLVTILLNSISDHKVYSKDIDDALKYAIEEVPCIESIPSVKSILNNKRTACDKHGDSEFIQVSCGFEHCALCIYSRIKEELSKPAIGSVYCPCRSIVPVKFMVEVKKSEGFKNFMKKK